MNFVAKSDIGKIRTNNEDSFFAKEYNEDVSLFVVADGMGGYASGEVASSIVTETMSTCIEEYINILPSKKEENVKEIFKEALTKANEKIFNLGKTDIKYEGMGTTVVAILKVKNNMYYTSVGDTRIYYIDDKLKAIMQITEDDSYVNELVKTNVITKEEAENHPQKHMLTKAVGILDTIVFDIKKINKKKGYLLLCTDGLTNMLNDREILKIIQENNFEYTAEKLVLKANEKGGNDNITVVILKKENS